MSRQSPDQSPTRYVKSIHFPSQRLPDAEDICSQRSIESPGLGVPFTQMPLQSPELSQTDLSQSAICSQSGPSYNFWQPDGVPVARFDIDSQRSQAVKGSQASPTFRDRFGGYSQTGLAFSQGPARPSCHLYTVLEPSDPLCVPKYLKSCLAVLRRDDKLFSPRTPLFQHQREVTEEMRKDIIYWYIEKAIALDLSSRAVFLAVKLMDRLLVFSDIDRAEFFLKGISCLSLAAKFENTYYPQTSSYCLLCNDEFVEEDLIHMEMTTFENLNFQTNSTTVILYMKIYMNNIKGTTQMSLAGMFVAMSTLIPSAFAIMDCELVAVASLAVVVNAITGKIDNEVLMGYIDQFDREQFIQTCELVVAAITAQLNDEDSPILVMFNSLDKERVATRYVYTVPALEVE